MNKTGTGAARRGRPPQHGMANTRTYRAWLAMRAACDNPRDPRWRTTGARGITYPNKWIVFERFMEDMGEAPKGAALKRRDTSKSYDTDNCQWV